MKVIGTIPTIDGLDDEAVRTQIAKGEPAIISGLVTQWPSFARWSRSYLVERVGGVTVSYRQSSSNVHPPLGRRHEHFAPVNRQATLARYLDLMADTPTVFLDANLVCLYARRGLANPELAPLHEDVRVPGFLDPASVDTIGLWMSGRGVQTRVHYDRNGRHNFNAQLSGRKEVVLIPPDQSANLYPFPMTSPTYNFSEVDSSSPDLGAFPGYANVTGFSGTLDAGHMLFLPAFWYHAFTHVGEFNLNLNFWSDAANVPLSAVALRNEVATLWAKARDAYGAGPERLAEELDRQALAWSPARSTTDEVLADAAPATALMPPAFTAPIPVPAAPGRGNGDR
ncbi:MAG TPA: cupin-like domain-containing protein [Trebonia sp.]